MMARAKPFYAEHAKPKGVTLYNASNVLGKRPHLELLLPSTWFHMDMHSDGHACHGKFITYMTNVHKGVKTKKDQIRKRLWFTKGKQMLQRSFQK